MTKRVLACAVVLGLAVSAFGQATRPSGSGGGGGGQLQQILQGYGEVLKGLELKPEQAEAIRGIMQGAVEKFRELQGEMKDVAPGDRRAKVQGLIKELNNSIAEKLDEGQRAKFAAGLQALNEKIRNGNVGPATRPASRPGVDLEGKLPAGGMIGVLAKRQLEGFRAAVDSLDLTADQKKRVDESFVDAQAKVADLRGTDPEARGKLQEITGQLRKELMEILTPEQQEALKEKMKNMRGVAGGRGGGGGGGEVKPVEPKGEASPKKDGGMDGGMGGMGDAPKLDSPPPAPPRGEGPAGPGMGGTAVAEVGQAAPELSVKKLDGGPVRLSAYKGRALVVVFGSYSAPTFREKAKQLSDLIRELHGKADFLVVYTAEAYPVGKYEVERNKDEKIRVEDHKTEAERVAAAKQAKATLKLEGNVVVDEMSDATAKAYGLMPNGAVLIGRDGVVLGRQKWFDGFGLRRMIEQEVKPATRPAGK